MQIPIELMAGVDSPQEEVVLGSSGADGVALLHQLVSARRGVLLDLPR